MPRPTLSAAPLVLAGLLLAGTSPRAAPPPTPAPDAAETELPPLEVRASAPLPRAQEDPAAAAWVVPRAELDRPGLDLAGVLEGSPGLQVSQLGGLGSFATVRLRGSTSDQVRVYLDGVLLNSSLGGGVDLSSLPLGPIERIEVYRGVVPDAQGGSAIGGALRLRTRRLDRRRVEAVAGGGSFATRWLRGFWAEPGERVALGLALDYQGTNGDFPFPHDNGTAYDASDDYEARRSNAQSDQLAALAKARVALADGATLVLHDQMSWSQRGLPSVALYPSRAASLGELRNVLALALLRPEGPGRALGFELRGSLLAEQRRLADPLGEIGLQARRTRDRSLSPRLGGHLSWSPSGWLRLQAGADLAHESFEPQEELAAAPERAAAQRQTLQTKVEAALDLPTLDLSALLSVGLEGAHSEGGSADSWGEATGTPREHDELAGTWRLGLVQRSLPRTWLKANVGRALRLPSLFELFGNSGYLRGNPDLTPERSLFADLGLEHRSAWPALGARVQAEVFGFRAQVEDLIQLVQTSQNVAVAENVAAAQLAGLELGLRGEALHHLRGRFAYTLLLSEDRSAVAARAGRQLPYRPRHQAAGRLEVYGRPLTALGELALYGEWDGLSGNYLDPSNLVAAPARSFLALGCSLGLWQDRLQLEGVARNLLDHHTVDLAGYPLPGRALFLTLRGRFDGGGRP